MDFYFLQWFPGYKGPPSPSGFISEVKDIPDVVNPHLIQLVDLQVVKKTILIWIKWEWERRFLPLRLNLNCDIFWTKIFPALYAPVSDLGLFEEASLSSFVRLGFSQCENWNHWFKLTKLELLRSDILFYTKGMNSQEKSMKSWIMLQLKQTRS